MEKDARYFLVGVFVTATLVALIGFLIWLAGTHDNRNYDYYTVYFVDPVSGLKEGNSVQYKGIEVGKVRSIRLSSNRNDLIKVDIEVDESTPIRSRTQASLAMMGVTGMVYMELTTDPNDRSAAERAPGERYPVIKGSGTQLARIIEDVPAISKQVLAMAEKLNAFMSDENLQALSDTMANIKQLSGDASSLVSDKNIEHASTVLANFADVSGDLKSMVADFDKTAAHVDEAVASLNALIADNRGNISQFTSEGLEQINATSRETRRTVEAVRSMVEKLETDPSQIIYQPSYRGVEISK